MKKFWAAEPHVNGTTKYEIGDERQVDDENEVKHLVDLGVLSETEIAKPKMAAATDNKAEGKAPANKSA